MLKNKSPLQSIKAYCLHHCMNHQAHEVKLCNASQCPFYVIRFGKKVPGISSLKAIKKYCVDCSEGARNTEKCPFTECQLYIYRKGKNPNRKGIGKSNLKCHFTLPDPNSRNVLKGEELKK